MLDFENKCKCLCQGSSTLLFVSLTEIGSTLAMGPRIRVGQPVVVEGFHGVGAMLQAMVGRGTL